MEEFYVGILNSGEWKWMAVVGVGALIVVATLLVSLFRGITWPALLALIFGGVLASAPVAVPLVASDPAPAVRDGGAGKDIAALAKANQAAAAELASGLKDVQAALDALGTAVTTAGRRAALSSESGAAMALNADLDSYADRVKAAAETMRGLARSVEASAAARRKLDAGTGE